MQLLLKHHSTDQIYIEVRTKTKNIESDIIRFIKQHRKIRNYLLLSRKGGYCRVLQVNGISAVPYHGLDAKPSQTSRYVLGRCDVVVLPLLWDGN
jgi:ATP-dependent DNA helicase RecQ